MHVIDSDDVLVGELAGKLGFMVKLVNQMPDVFI